MAIHSGGPTATLTERHRRWHAHVDAQARDARSQRSYCEDNGLAYSSFTYWRRRLRGRDTPATSAASATPPPASGFVPVAVHTGAADSHTSSVALAVVLPSGLRIEGVDGANIGTVAALVAAL